MSLGTSLLLGIGATLLGMVLSHLLDYALYKLQDKLNEKKQPCLVV